MTVFRAAVLILSLSFLGEHEPEKLEVQSFQP